MGASKTVTRIRPLLGGIGSLFRLELVRTRRDATLMIMWGAIFLLPLFSSLMLTGGAIHLLGLTGLLLPMWVGRDWGADVESGALGVIGLRMPAGPLTLLVGRALVYASMIFITAVPCLAIGRVSWLEGIFVTSHLMELTFLGLFLSTILRSQQAGWIPLFAAIFGVWLPFASIQTRLVEATMPSLLKLAMLAFVPHLGVKQGIFSLETSAIGTAFLALLWLIGACFAALRASAFMPRGSRQ